MTPDTPEDCRPLRDISALESRPKAAKRAATSPSPTRTYRVKNREQGELGDRKSVWPGDVVLENGLVRFAISATAPPDGYPFRPGRIVDASVLPSDLDLLDGVRLTARRERGRSFVSYEEVKPHAVTDVWEAEGTLKVGRRKLGVRTIFELRPGEAVLRLLHEISVEGKPVEVVAGLNMVYGNHPTYVSGEGDVRGPATFEQQWAGRSGSGLSYGVSGLDDTPRTVETHTFPVGPVEFLKGFTLWEPPQIVEAGAPILVRHIVAAAQGGPKAVATALRKANPSLQAETEPKTGARAASAPGSVRVIALNDSGCPIYARAIFDRIDGLNPDFGYAESLSGTGNVGFVGDGGLVRPLLPGAYRVRVTKGPEYTLWEESRRVAAGAQTVVVAELKRVVDTRGWVAADLHLHQSPSIDSHLSLEQRVLTLAAEGVEFAVATDHNHRTDLSPAVEALDLDHSLKTAIGNEVTTSGRLWGHFLAFPLTAVVGAPGAGATPWHSRTPKSLFEGIRKDPGEEAIIVAHPRLTFLGYFNRIRMDRESGVVAHSGADWDFDGIEITNGLELSDPSALEQNLKDWYRLLNQGHRLTAVGSSDSHGIALQEAGYPRTYIELDDRRIEDIDPEAAARALKAGRALVTNGPFIRAALRPGPNGLEHLRVRVEAAPWIDVREVRIVGNGETLLTIPVRSRTTAIRLDREFQVRSAPEGESWFVVEARGRQPLDQVLTRRGVLPFAVTNPLRPASRTN